MPARKEEIHESPHVPSPRRLRGRIGFLGPLHALGVRAAAGEQPVRVAGYGPLVLKGDLWLPAAFNYVIISRQGQPMSDGALTPGLFDGMGAFPGAQGTTILIRNHENRERAGETKVVTGPAFEYDELATGGNTKLEVRRTNEGVDQETGEQVYTYEVVRQFAILGGTTTNCAGGTRQPTPGSPARKPSNGPRTARSTATSSRSTRGPTVRLRQSPSFRQAASRTKRHSSRRASCTSPRIGASRSMRSPINDCLARASTGTCRRSAAVQCRSPRRRGRCRR